MRKGRYIVLAPDKGETYFVVKPEQALRERLMGPVFSRGWTKSLLEAKRFRYPQTARALARKVNGGVFKLDRAPFTD